MVHLGTMSVPSNPGQPRYRHIQISRDFLSNKLQWKYVHILYAAEKTLQGRCPVFLLLFLRNMNGGVQGPSRKRLLTLSNQPRSTKSQTDTLSFESFCHSNPLAGEQKDLRAVTWPILGMQRSIENLQTTTERTMRFHRSGFALTVIGAHLGLQTTPS